MKSGKGLLFPLIANECSYKQNPSLKTETELRACAVNTDNGVTDIESLLLMELASKI